jgi:hypothetical protein
MAGVSNVPNYAGLVDLDDPADAVFHDHGVSVFKSLEGVHFEPLSFVAVTVLGIVAPDCFNFRVNLDQFPPTGQAKNVAVFMLLNAVNRSGPEFHQDAASCVVFDDLVLVACEYAVPY